MVKDIAIGAEGLKFGFRFGQIGYGVANRCPQLLATAAIFLWSCVALALSREDKPRHSLHVSA